MGRIIGSAISSAAGITQAGINLRGQKYAADKNLKSVQETNAINKQIADDANELQYSMHQEDMNFNAEQAQIQREWDSADAQRERLVEAGYNPLMIGDGFSDGGQSAASAPGTPSANVATMNPNIQDPFSFDALGALAQAFGVGDIASEIDERRARTKGLELKNTFDTETYSTRVEMEQARDKWILEQYNEYIGSKDFREAGRAQQRKAWQFFNDMAERATRDSDAVFEHRKEEYAWWKETTEEERKKFPLRLQALQKQLAQMDAQTAVFKAQEKKLIAETTTIDQMREEDIKLIKAQLAHLAISDALASLHVPAGQRSAFGTAIMTMCSDGNVQPFFDALDKVSYNGDMTNWFTAAQRYMGLTSAREDIGGIGSSFARGATGFWQGITSFLEYNLTGKPLQDLGAGDMPYSGYDWSGNGWTW